MIAWLTRLLGVRKQTLPVPRTPRSAFVDVVSDRQDAKQLDDPLRYRAPWTGSWTGDRRGDALEFDLDIDYHTQQLKAKP